ncbi:hypothetical protein [Actinomadura kijaniata]|uniref:hypothetical protein n=1 Tax=Actinomadura kijaniata TaxID=46161 RepID=UPI000AA49CF5|nr:hypothetical protein [Actinomadura kijaniata]
MGRHPVAVSLCDGGLRVRDVRTFGPFDTPPRQSPEACAAACAEVDGRAVMVTTSGYDTVQGWDLATGALFTPARTGHTATVSGDEDGAPIR